MHHCPVCAGRVYLATRLCEERGGFSTHLELLNLRFFSWCRFLCSSSSAVSLCRSKLFRTGVTVWRPRDLVIPANIALACSFSVRLSFDCNLYWYFSEIQLRELDLRRLGLEESWLLISPWWSVCCYSLNLRKLRYETTMQFTQCIVPDYLFMPK